MTITSVEPEWGSQRGRLTSTGLEFSARYKVTSDDPMDGPEVVLSDTRLPIYNSVYKFGNDYHPQARLKEMVPSRSGGRVLWAVNCVWRTPDPDDPQDDNDDPTGDTGTGDESDLFERGPYKILEILMRSTREVVTLCRFFGKFHTGLDPEGRPRVVHHVLGAEDELYPGRRLLSWGPVTNSAGIPKLPAPEIDDANLVLRVTRAWPKWKPEWDERYIGAINGDTVRVADPTGGRFFDRTFRKWTLKCNAITLNERLTNLSTRMWVTMEVEYNRKTWLHDELDSGNMRRVESGGDDSYGGKYPTDLTTVGVENGIPYAANIRDHSGGRAASDVLLDGRGLPLPHGRADTAHYVTFLLHDLLSFNALRL